MDAQKRTRRGGGKKKQQAHSADIVFTKNGSIQIMPSLTKRLKAVTDPVIGLQYVWEFRSPTKSVPPHYQCKLCKVTQLQSEMAAHIVGWKHNFRYLKHSHADKMPHLEEEVNKDSSIKSAIKLAAAEVEKTEGRGQLQVVIKEPSEVIAFQNMKTAQPSMSGPGPGPLFSRGRLPGLGGSFGRGIPEPLFPEFPLHGGMMSDGLSGPGRFSGPDNMQLFPNSRSMNMGSDGFGMGPQSEGMNRIFPDDLPMSSSRMIGLKDSESSSTLSVLLTHLDKFRIECEDDAQIVLKITQKLTDVLMEYRLRSISSGSEMNSQSPSLSNMNYSSRLPLSASDWLSNNRFSSERFSSDRFSSDRFSSNMSGPSRFFN